MVVVGEVLREADEVVSRAEVLAEGTEAGTEVGTAPREEEEGVEDTVVALEAVAVEATLRTDGLWKCLVNPGKELACERRKLIRSTCLRCDLFYS